MNEIIRFIVDVPAENTISTIDSCQCGQCIAAARIRALGQECITASPVRLDEIDREMMELNRQFNGGRV